MLISALMALWACASPPEPAPPPAPPPEPAPVPAPEPVDQPARIVAVGDLHADLDNALAVLKLAGVTDDEGRWAGGETVLVQTGDTTDRGPDSGALLDLMQTLPAQAEAAGGRVVPLVGNHEVMNLLGDWRYVDPGDVEAYGGLDARKKAFALDGDDGKWISQASVVAKVGDAVFVHGGVTEEYAKLGVDAINDQARQAMRSGGGPVLGERGPLWFRGYVTDPEASACPALARALGALGAKRMVVGHTTRRDGKVEERCGGRLLVIDIGIADHYGANLGAIEIVGGDAKAIYPSGVVDLADPK